MGPVDRETQQLTESQPNRWTSPPNNNQSHATQMMKTTMMTTMTTAAMTAATMRERGGEGGSNDATIKQTMTTRTRMTKTDDNNGSNGRAETWTRREVGGARQSKQSFISISDIHFKIVIPLLNQGSIEINHYFVMGITVFKWIPILN